MAQFLTSQQFGDAIGVHVETVRSWDRSGKLKAHHVTVGGRLMYTRQQVVDYLLENPSACDNEDPKYLTVREFADKIGVTPKTIRLWDKTGKLKPHHRGRNNYRLYTEDQVDEYFSRR